MAYTSLNSFIDQLEKEGELIRIKEFVNPHLEITEITDRFSKQGDGGKALLFENTGTSFPLLINAFGSSRRMNLALGVHDLNDIGKRIEGLLMEVTSPKTSFMDKLKLLPTLKNISNFMPRKRKGKGRIDRKFHVLHHVGQEHGDGFPHRRGRDIRYSRLEQ